MANPYRNTGKCNSPAKQTNPDGTSIALEYYDNPKIQGNYIGALGGAFKNAMKLGASFLKSTGPRGGGQYKLTPQQFDKNYIESMKFNTLAGAPSEDPKMKI